MEELQTESRLSDFQTSVLNMKPHFVERPHVEAQRKSNGLTITFWFIDNNTKSIRTLALAVNLKRYTFVWPLGCAIK